MKRRREISLCLFFFKKFNKMHFMKFANQVVLITGGAGLIGKNLAQAFLNEGARVVITSRNRENLKQLAESLDPTQTHIKVFPGDLKDIERAQKLADFCKKEFGRLDILINNAGLYIEKPFLDHTKADYDEHVDCILKGTFFLSQAAACSMVEQGRGGAIINIGSSWGIKPVKQTPSSAHSIAKAGVHMLTQSLALELAPYKIRVNAVAPGIISETREKNYKKSTPLGHNGIPSDVTNAVLFLSSQEAEFITGVTLPVDGGMMVGV